MKTLFCIFTLSLTLCSSISAQDILDALVGTYVPDEAVEAKVIVKKVFLTQATLFVPAKYEYQVEVISNDSDLANIGGEGDRIRTLRVGEDKNSLVLWMKKGCDPTDCMYFDEIEIIIENNGGEPSVTINSSGWRPQYDESVEDPTFESKYFFSKK